MYIYIYVYVCISVCGVWVYYCDASPEIGLYTILLLLIWHVNGKTGGAGGTHLLHNKDRKIQREGGAMKEVVNAKNRIDSCTNLQETNESLVKTKPRDSLSKSPPFAG